MKHFSYKTEQLIPTTSKGYKTPFWTKLAARRGSYSDISLYVHPRKVVKNLLVNNRHIADIGCYILCHENTALLDIARFYTLSVCYAIKRNEAVSDRVYNPSVTDVTCYTDTK